MSKVSSRQLKRDEIRIAAENDFKVFCRLVNPKRMYGHVHEEVMDWWQDESSGDDLMLLLPRAHQKSHLAAMFAAWTIVRKPYITILYISATATLAEKQLYAIKNVLTSPKVMSYWPELINEDEGKREKWTTTEISVDHPLRKEEGVRDSTVIASGLTGNITGLHCDFNFIDDAVVPTNAYTEEGRNKVSAMYSQLSSIENTGAKTIVVGTRYHPRDLYHTLLNIKLDVFDDEGELENQIPLFEVKQKVVETEDEFLWPKMMREDGRFFGFDKNELAKKRAKYIDVGQFYAQYYNNPNKGGNSGIKATSFQYYKRNKVEQINGDWYYQNRKLNIYASIDFAFSLKKKADYTAIVVVGVDFEANYYVLDIERFKTKRIGEYFDYIFKLNQRWEFRKMRAETTVAQAAIVDELKRLVVENGLYLKIEEFRPPTNGAKKEERINSILEPKYDAMKVYHYKGGWCQTLEEELILEHPPHDDIKDAFATAADMAIIPKKSKSRMTSTQNIVTHPRFGGVAY